MSSHVYSPVSSVSPVVESFGIIVIALRASRAICYSSRHMAFEALGMIETKGLAGRIASHAMNEHRPRVSESLCVSQFIPEPPRIPPRIVTRTPLLRRALESATDRFTNPSSGPTSAATQSPRSDAFV